MNKDNNIKLNEDYVVDIELLRIESLIEKREEYEEKFFSVEPPFDEFDYIISQYNMELESQEINYIPEDFKEDLENPFELEDRMNQLRDEMLIEEREKYENDPLPIVLDEFALNDFYDFQIEAMEEEEFLKENVYDDYEPDFDSEYWQYEEDMFWKLHYLRQTQFEQPKCGCAYMDYMPHDDGLCDYLDCYDYPEGPEENLNGIKFY